MHPLENIIRLTSRESFSFLGSIVPTNLMGKKIKLIKFVHEIHLIKFSK